MSVTHPTLADRLRWICNTSADEGIREIARLLKANDGKTATDLRQLLLDAQAMEIHGQHRSSLLLALKRALKKVDSAITTQALSIITAHHYPMTNTKITTPPSLAENVPATMPAILADAKSALDQLRSKLVSQEEAFFQQSLPDRVKMGLHCLKAHVIFNIADPGNRGQGRKPKNHVTADVITPQGFEGWLAAECPWLKKPTAYKYMTALKGLGLNESATEEEVDEALRQNQRIGPVSIKSLCNAAVEAIAPPAEPPARIEQSEFEFLRDGLSAFRQQSDALLALKAELHKHPDMERVASARIYSLLVEITGCHWKPSDEPDALADVNPDAIEL